MMRLDDKQRSGALVAAVALAVAAGCGNRSEPPVVQTPAKGVSAMQERFTFASEGDQIVGTLFMPETKPIGIVVTSGPLTSVKEQAAGTYAKAMAARGFAAIAFDHRYFGESGGQPRQLENPAAKIEDIRNAATALLADGRFAGLPVFGDARFRGMAGIAGVYTDAAKTRQAMGAAYQPAIDAAREAERVWRETGVAETIPAVAPDGGNVGMPLREAYDFYGTPRGAVPNYVNGFAVQSRSYLLPFDAMGAAAELKAPLLIVHSERALLPDLARQFHAKTTAPKQELWLASQGQIDFYDDPKLIAASADAAAAWFKAQLAPK